MRHARARQGKLFFLRLCQIAECKTVWNKRSRFHHRLVLRQIGKRAVFDFDSAAYVRTASGAVEIGEAESASSASRRIVRKVQTDIDTVLQIKGILQIPIDAAQTQYP